MDSYMDKAKETDHSKHKQYHPGCKDCDAMADAGEDILKDEDFIKRENEREKAE